MPPTARTRAQQRRREWLVLTLALLALVAWLSPAGQMAGLNHLLQDLGLRAFARAPHPDIVLVAVDDRSIATVGRWPWRRALHAQLLQAIDAQHPRAIGLDILFSEADANNPLDDALLAEAIGASGRVALPVLQRNYAGLTEGASEMPLHMLSQAAAALGHVHVTPDGDGVVRGLYLREGPANAPWYHLSQALRCIAPSAAPTCQSSALRAPAHDGRSYARTDTAAVTAPTPWVTQQHELIAYAGGPAHYPTYAYIDVLRGLVPRDAFKDKYVLVGAAASGLGDLFATPVSSGAHLMPGVELVAQVLDGQLSNVRLQRAPTAANMVFNLVPVALALGALLMLGPLSSLLASAAMAVGTVLLSMLLAVWTGWQFAPAAALLGLVLAYPLWSWRRLSAAAQFLRAEIDQLQHEGFLPPKPTAPGSADFLERRINAVESASRQLRNLHQFVSHSLQQLPSPNFVCDAQGRILLSNRAALEHTGLSPMGSPNALQGKPITQVLGDLAHAHTGEPLITKHRLQRKDLPAHSEGLDNLGRSLYVLCKPFTEFSNVGWLITLVDMTPIRRAVQQRDQALHFISHDIRAPNASILTLLEMHRAAPGHLPPDELLQRIERYARASLGMAESFVRLAGAQTQDFRITSVDLVAVLMETVDDAWALACERKVEIALWPMPETACTAGDRSLLSRAITNVLNNAVKYSPDGGIVRCGVQARGTHWVVCVRDEGPGISASQKDLLFAPFSRLHDQSHPQVNGVGLGLALVQTVVQRHGGSIEVESAPGHGAEFRLVFLASDEAGSPSA